MKPEFDGLLRDIAEYVMDNTSFSADTLRAARWAFLDALGCSFAGITSPTCAKWLKPSVEGAVEKARIPGTHLFLHPFEAVFGFGSAIRWLDFNDTWLAAEWGHPSDNLAALLPTADFLCRGGRFTGISMKDGDITIADVLDALTRAYEIQGVLAMENSLNRRGFDHVLFVKVATAASVCRLLGASVDEALSAVSNAFADVSPLRVYRHGENTGWRKSWAAADASVRGLQFALMAMRGEMGYPSVLRAKRWGFEDVVMGGEPLKLAQRLSDHVIRHVLFKAAYPAEFHAQTALEAAIRLHPLVAARIDEIEKIRIETHEAAIRIIDKRGPLANPADRDHCLQYIVAVGLLKGMVKAEDYEDLAAADPRIDELRARMDVIEYPPYSRDYLAAEKRSAASRVLVTLKEGEKLPPVEVIYPLGHPRRRSEVEEHLVKKFTDCAVTVYDVERASHLAKQLWLQDTWTTFSVDKFVDLLAP